MRMAMLLLLLLLGGCGPGNPNPEGGPMTPSSVPPTNTAPVTSPISAAATGGVGFLAGHATIGPLSPIGGLPVTPPPQACTARGITVSPAAGTAPTSSVKFQPDCSFRLVLNPGTYVVRLMPNGIDTSQDLPATVQIVSGVTVQLVIRIDTGMR